MTLPQAAGCLGIHPAKLRRGLKDGVFPSPTFINEYGLNFFDDDWLTKARALLSKSFEGKAQSGWQ